MRSFQQAIRASACALLLGCVGIIGCEDSENPITQPNRLGAGYMLPGFAGTDRIYSREEAVDFYNRSNLCAVFWLTSNSRDDYVTGGGGVPTGQFNGVDNDAQATFRSYLNQELSVGDIRLNNAILQEYAPGAYYYRSSRSDSLDLLFGGGYNTIQVRENAAGVPPFLDSVQFSPAPKLIGLSRGQSIPKGQPLTLHWNGSGSDSWVEIVLRRADALADTGSILGFEYITDDDGEFTIPAYVMSRVKPTLTHVSIRRAEARYVSLKDGRVVCVLGEPKHTVTVGIVP